MTRCDTCGGALAGYEAACARCGALRVREPVGAGHAAGRTGAGGAPDAAGGELTSWFGAIGAAASPAAPPVAAPSAPPGASPAPPGGPLGAPGPLGGPRLAAPPLKPGMAVGARGAPGAPPSPPGPGTRPAGGVDASYCAPARLGVPGPAVGEPHERVPTAGSQWTAPRPPEPRRRLGRVAALLAAVVIGAGVYAGRPYLRELLDPPPEGTAAFLDGDGVAYTAPEAGFTARFPAEPVVETATVPVPGLGPVSVHTAYASGDEWEMGVGSAEVGAVDPRAVDAALSGGAAGMASVGGVGRVTDQSPTEHDGLRALDATVEVGDDHPARVRVIYDGRRIHVLAVHSKGATGRLFDELVSSFAVHDGAI